LVVILKGELEQAGARVHLKNRLGVHAQRGLGR
jgi:hypothetical protein